MTSDVAAAQTEQLDADLIEAEKILNGGDDYTDYLTYKYLLNFMKHTPVNSPSAYRFCYAVKGHLPEDDMKAIKFPTKAYQGDNARKKIDLGKFYPHEAKPPKNGVVAEDWEKLQKYLEKKLAETTDFVYPDMLTNLMRLTDLFGFTAQEKAVMELIYAAAYYPLNPIIDKLTGMDSKVIGPVAARMLDTPKKFREITKLLSKESPLLRYGMLAYGNDPFPEIEDQLAEKLETEVLDDQTVAKILLGKPANTDLTLDDFTFIGPELRYMVELVKHAVERGEKGINLLIYGPPGGGKTELAKAISKELGLSMYSIGEEKGEKQTVENPVYDSDGDVVGMQKHGEEKDDKVSRQRLSQLLRAQALLTGNKTALVMFDEIEDLLLKGTDSEKKADTESKIEINRLLETNPVVTIWVGNDTDKFHGAVRDRFAYSLFVDYPPTLVRQKIWQRQLGLQNVTLSDTETLELARAYEATPRQITKAVRMAAITGKGMEAIKISLPASSKISYQNSEAVSAGSKISKNFDLGLVSLKGDVDAEPVIEDLIARGRAAKPFALMAKGPKGSGINSALRYVGEQMTKNVLEVSMAELSQPSQSMFGLIMPEQKVRDAFSMAAEGRRFMIIRDIEQIVPDPKSLSAQWHENSLVDEFLRCATRHRLPFAAVTHEKVDMPESFTHVFSSHMDFANLSEDRAKKTFEKFFGTKPDFEMPTGLVLADFSNVKKLLARGLSDASATDIRAMLEKQKEYRGLKNAGIGYTARP